MYVDLIFSKKNKISERNSFIGFIGRLSKEKGILNLVESIPNLLTQDNTLKFLIVGNGELSIEIENTLKEKNLLKSIKLVNWIAHPDLPDCLNKIKVIVLPSYTEGVPNIILEAMACGTPVLANSVGGIPSIIKNGYNGFLMSDNSPESITKNLLKVLNDEETIETISHNGLKLIEEDYRYESSLKRYKKILNILRT